MYKVLYMVFSNGFLNDLTYVLEDLYYFAVTDSTNYITFQRQNL